MKMLILTADKTTLSWSSLDKKLAAIKIALNGGRNADWLIEVQYKPATPIIKDERISHDWLEEHLKDYYQGYDIVAFHYTYKQKVAWGVRASLRGSNPNRKDTLSDLYFWSDEDTKRKGLSQFVETCLHEIAHEYFQQTKLKDITHNYHEKNDSIVGLYKTLDWSKFKPRISAQKKQINLLERIVAALKAQLVPKPPTRLLHPVVKYRELISQEYGRPNKNFYPQTGHHIGTDYACPVGTPVLAPWKGEVTVSGASAALGNFCHYKYTFDGVTYVARFMHLSAIPPVAKYARGEVIELSGKTGKITGPHLHVDIFYNDVRLDLLTAKNWNLLTLDPQSHYV